MPYDWNTGLSGPLSSPSGLLGTLSNEVLRGFSAYDLACQHGFVGSEEQWLESLKGDQIQLRVTEELNFEWKYSEEEEWHYLMNMDEYRDYLNLLNKPSINEVEVVGDLTLEQLGIQELGDYVETKDITVLSNQEIEDEFKF